MTVKSYLAPDIAQSIRSGVPQAHLAPDIAQAIRTPSSSRWIAPDIAEDIISTIDSGGGAPDWVPANAKIYIDLVGNRAWTEADGIVAIDTLLGSDPNTVNGWGATAYDAADLTENGLVYSAHPPALIGTARSAMLSGGTMRMQQVSTTTGNPNTSIALVATNGSDALEADLSAVNIAISSWGGSLVGHINSVANVSYTDSGIVNAMALTVVDDRFELAANGSSVIIGSLASNDRPVANPLSTVVVDVSFGALQSIAIYDPLPDTTGLSALSDTG